MSRIDDNAVVNVRLTGGLCAIAAAAAAVLPMASSVAALHPWTKIIVPIIIVSSLGVVARVKMFAAVLGGTLIIVAVAIFVSGLLHFEPIVFVVRILGITLLLWPAFVLYTSRRALR